MLFLYLSIKARRTSLISDVIVVLARACPQKPTKMITDGI
jgi:hypothetical protein